MVFATQRCPGQVFVNGNINCIKTGFSRAEIAPLVISGFDRTQVLKAGRAARVYDKDALLIETLVTAAEADGLSLQLKAGDASGATHEGGDIVLQPDALN